MSNSKKPVVTNKMLDEVLAVTTNLFAVHICPLFSDANVQLFKEEFDGNHFSLYLRISSFELGDDVVEGKILIPVDIINSTEDMSNFLEDIQNDYNKYFQKLHLERKTRLIDDKITDYLVKTLGDDRQRSEIQEKIKISEERVKFQDFLAGLVSIPKQKFSEISKGKQRILNRFIQSYESMRKAKKMLNFLNKRRIKTKQDYIQAKHKIDQLSQEIDFAFYNKFEFIRIYKSHG